MIFESEKFLSALENAGLNPEPFEPVIDGKIHRFRDINLDGPRKLNGWYILHNSGEFTVGKFGHWKTDINEKFYSREYSTLTADEKAAFKAEMDFICKTADEERLQAQAACRKISSEIWQNAQPATKDYPYLVNKKIHPHGVRVFGDCIIIPVRIDGTITGLQFISPKGGKKFKAGTEITGGYFSIGTPTDNTFLVCEGFATGASLNEATGNAVAVAFNATNLTPVALKLREKNPDAKLVICADDDHMTLGNPGLTKATKAARAVGGKLAVPKFPAYRGPKDTDFNDLVRIVGSETVKEAIEVAAIPELIPATDTLHNGSPHLCIIDALDFLGMQFPPREHILTPWLPQQGLVMVYGQRGIGKTHVSLGIAYAVASGGRLFGWQAPKPVGVLFLDGEMPAVVLQERLAHIAISSDREPNVPLRIVTPDLQPSGMIDLARLEDQRSLNPYLEGIGLIVVDNLSSLCRTGKENEGEGWLPVQEWSLQQRAAGRSVAFFHHAGKNGEQRGTSRREDVLDTVIALRRPGDYTQDKGACFEVHFEKSRGIYGDDTKPFEAQLITTPDGRQEWVTKLLEQSTAEKVAALLNEGIPQHEIAELLGVSKGTVSKSKKKAVELGLLIAA